MSCQHWFPGRSLTSDIHGTVRDTPPLLRSMRGGGRFAAYVLRTAMLCPSLHGSLKDTGATGRPSHSVMLVHVAVPGCAVITNVSELGWAHRGHVWACSCKCLSCHSGYSHPADHEVQRHTAQVSLESGGVLDDKQGRGKYFEVGGQTSPGVQGNPYPKLKCFRI